MVYPIDTAKAQSPDTGAGPVQPWGLPPLPQGVGPIEKFADIHDTPQGRFLEGGAFGTQGNLWFVGIGSGWISYLTPEGKLVPVVNCNPPEEIGTDLRATGHPLAQRQAVSDHPPPRHPGLRSRDEGAKDAGLHLPQPALQRPERPRLRLRRRGQPVLYRSVGNRSPAQPVRPQRRGVQYSKDGVLRKVMDGG
jgi:gluconolactonase